MSDVVHNERTKLTAAWLHAIASGIMITGVVAPLIAAYLNFAGAAQIGPLPLIISSGTCFVVSLLVHSMARVLHGGLK
jgi:hypothetical protein